MTPASVIVIDANLAAKVILPAALEGQNALDRLADWHSSRVHLVAPDILLPEVVSVVRWAIFNRLISAEDGQAAAEDAFRLGIEVIPSDPDLCRNALVWAERLTQSRAYDGFYLALAERMSAELWTYDKRLAHRTRQLGIDWVRSPFEGEAQL